MIAQIKKIVKYYTAIFLYYSGLLAFYSLIKKLFLNRCSFTVLMYHRVLEENDVEMEYVQPGIFISRPVFEKQMAFLSKKYNLLSLKELAEMLMNNQSPPRKSIVLTFDDGWRDNYKHAYPILKKYNVPATIFLTTDFIDTDNMFWFDELSMILSMGKISSGKMAEIIKRNQGDTNESPPQHLDSDRFIEELKRLDLKTIREIITELIKESGLSPEKIKRQRHMLTWDEVSEMSENNIDFGSHGRSHRILTNINMDEVIQELIESKNRIEEKLGGQAITFSYPNGNFNSEIKKQVAEAGYSCAVATNSIMRSIDQIDILELRRKNVHEDISVGPNGDFSKSMFSLHIER